MDVSTKMGVAAAAVAAVLLTGAAAGVAQDKLAQVTARQDFMKAQGKDFSTISNWSKGKSDQKAALAAVDDLLKRNPEIINHFPPGTSAEDFPGKSKAKADLWKNMDHVKESIAKVRTGEENLRATIEKGDAAAAGKQATAVYRNDCNSCHNSFRLSERS
ncbi:MAG: cytochrome c [Stellaceae bacterium]